MGARPRSQPSSAARGYGHAWRKLRLAYLAAHPWCAGVQGQHHPKCDGRATVPDHHPTTRAELVRLGVPDPDSWHRLQPLSEPCHRQKTLKFDGGYGNPKKNPASPAADRSWVNRWA